MNIPDSLWLQPQTQIYELGLKSFASSDPNNRLYVAAVTFKTIQNFTYRGSRYNEGLTQAAIKITGPDRLKDDLSSKITYIIDTLGNQSGNTLRRFSTDNAIYILRSISVMQETTVFPLIFPIITLAGTTVTIEAFGSTYEYTFPAADNTAAWLPILSSDKIEFTKQA